MRMFICILTLLNVLCLQPQDEQLRFDDNYKTESVSTYATSVKWYYRTYNGVRQKRLLSVREQVWLTDWIDC